MGEYGVECKIECEMECEIEWRGEDGNAEWECRMGCLQSV